MAVKKTAKKATKDKNPAKNKAKTVAQSNKKDKTSSKVKLSESSKKNTGSKSNSKSKQDAKAQASAVGKREQKVATKQETKHWFPVDAKPPTAATAAPKRSPWQRRQVIVNYGTLALPGINFKQKFHEYLDKKHKKLSEQQRQMLWLVVGNKMLSEPLSNLENIIEENVKLLPKSK